MCFGCMAFPLTLFPTGDPSLHPINGDPFFCSALGINVSLSSGYHPQTDRANQELETALRFVRSANPSSSSAQLPWVEYAHNTLLNASSGMSPFECAPF